MKCKSWVTHKDGADDLVSKLGLCRLHIRINDDIHLVPDKSIVCDWSRDKVVFFWPSRFLNGDCRSEEGCFDGGSPLGGDGGGDHGCWVEVSKRRWVRYEFVVIDWRRG